MPSTAAASSRVRNSRSGDDGMVGTDRDTRTSTGWCGCVVPSSAAFSVIAYPLSTSVRGQPSLKLSEAAAAPHHTHSPRNPPKRQKFLASGASRTLAAPPADRSGGVKTELPQHSEEERSRRRHEDQLTIEFPFLRGSADHPMTPVLVAPGVACANYRTTRRIDGQTSKLLV